MRSPGSQPLRVPAFVENVFELLGSADAGHPGDFYLDSNEGFVYYVAREGETPSSVVGQLPTIEALVDAEGVTDVSYHGITFEHSTWMRPSTPCVVPVLTHTCTPRLSLSRCTFFCLFNAFV